MNSIYDTVIGLTTNAPTSIEKSTLVQSFARELGWTPSYSLYPFLEEDIVNIHLVVEHGLENSAVLSFLKVPFDTLNEYNRKLLLNLSYNNLVDWHIHIDKTKVTYVYNRNNYANNIIQESTFRNEQYEALRSDAFEKIIGKRQSPNIPPLDDALINTISHWKRTLSAELNNEVSNEQLSELFNSIMFIRALEDNAKRYNPENLGNRVLLDAWKNTNQNINAFTDLISNAQQLLNKLAIPKYLLNIDNLYVFNKLDRQTVAYLLNDFYQNRIYGFYNYDFSIMSQHALSRIYEKYVAILKTESSNQLALFPKLPTEETNKAYGAVYTPQYIARFFGRYLRQNLPPSIFNKIKIAEPAVGSGIFLRSILEIKCDPRIEENSSDKIKEAFTDIIGIDIDKNACQAATLSLALLQLVLTNEFPEELNINHSETISFLKEHPELYNTYDAVVSNPPFIATELLSKEMKDRINEFLERVF